MNEREQLALHSWHLHLSAPLLHLLASRARTLPAARLQICSFDVHPPSHLGRDVAFTDSRPPTTALSASGVL